MENDNTMDQEVGFATAPDDTATTAMTHAATTTASTTSRAALEFTLRAATLELCGLRSRGCVSGLMLSCHPAKKRQNYF